MRTALAESAQAAAPVTPAPKKAAARKKPTLKEKLAAAKAQIAELKSRGSGRREFNTSDVKVDQLTPPDLTKDRESPIVQADNSMLDKEYADRLAFMDEEVTIQIEPSGGENAPDSYGVWVNGRGGEIKMANGEWVEYRYFPVGIEIITKRKYLAVLAASKANNVQHDDEDSARQKPRVKTSAVCSITLIEDRNPRGQAWLAEVRRRNF